MTLCICHPIVHIVNKFGFNVFLLLQLQEVFIIPVPHFILVQCRAKRAPRGVLRPLHVLQGVEISPPEVGGEQDVILVHHVKVVNKIRHALEILQECLGAMSSIAAMLSTTGMISYLAISKNFSVM